MLININIIDKYLGLINSLLLRALLFRIFYVSLMDWRLTPKRIKGHLTRGTRMAAIFHPPLSKSFKTGKALVIYHSTTGNTKKVALAIQRGLREGGFEPIIKEVSEALIEDLYNYDLVCFGSSAIHSLPPTQVMEYISKKGLEYRKRYDVKLPANKIPGKNALVFVTFSGPHIGVNEALPTGKYLRQFFEHLGFAVKGELYIISEFHGWKEGSTKGYLGDIKGRPNIEDLKSVEEKTYKIANALK